MQRTQVISEDVQNIISGIGLETLADGFNNKTVFIAGATGMIGMYFIYILSSLNLDYGQDIKIIACLRKPEKFDQELLSKDGNIHILQHDITRPLPEELRSEVDYYIHAASPASPLIMKEKPLETNYANTLGMANIVNAAIGKRGVKILFISSREVYGEPVDGQEHFYEDRGLGQVDPLVPRNGYAEGKKAAENMCVSAKAEYGLDTKIVRLAHTYGPGMSIDDGRVQADFLRNIIRHEDIVLKSEGRQVRTYTYVSDAVLAMLLVLLNAKDVVYNISDEASKVSIRELAERLLMLPEARGLKLRFEMDDNNSTGSASFTAGILSSDKIRNELSWRPVYPIEEGFSRTLKHLEEGLKARKRTRG